MFLWLHRSPKLFLFNSVLLFNSFIVSSTPELCIFCLDPKEGKEVAWPEMKAQERGENETREWEGGLLKGIYPAATSDFDFLSISHFSLKTLFLEL